MLGQKYITRSFFTILYYMLLNRFLVTSLSSGQTMFKHVCLGGTFDGIHAGHKLLFGEATKLCKERLVVGVTDSNMIRNKILWELITPVEERIACVRQYLVNINPNIKYEIVPINDIYGPAITDKELECIVVSEETIKGAQKINEVRAGKGWPELSVHVVNLLQDTDSNDQDTMRRLKEKKVSSSLLRAQKLGTIFRQPEPNDSIPRRPYLIGLTGGVASGKTTIGEYLKSIGFGLINYDSLGHKTYEKIGSPVYEQIVNHFGTSVLDESSKMINRKALGRIVFGDKEQLKRLNDIVWPGIYALVDEEIERLKDKYEVIVLESALLVESGQTKRVHQVWTTIVPVEEAIKRQVETRGLTESEARERVAAQIDNQTRIRNSNAVFCTIWDKEFTRQQVERAVKELRSKYLV